MNPKSPLPQPQPTTPLQGEMRPFGFKDANITRLASRARAQAGSRWAVIKPKRASRGLIWRGRPYYWTRKGYYRSGSGDRRPLQHLMWEAHHGRRMPAQHEIFFRDRDRHNFSLGNLELLSKAELHKRTIELGETLQISLEQLRQISGIRWTRHARKGTALLLKNFNQENKHEHQHIESIQALAERR